ncbi:NADP-dependent isocitrate dehydrogenase [Sulfurimonas sp. C5]|uniref:NADP-dependent isocitrate dehydrogenase n=1 Tax=Sulfurimonas sp. C5 TaxID=3036947 RepID=UPI0024575C21|nr:NADP-dependent isocitrate dehydrogenase [Sulfurimonas sp. C5]MDH4943943.1 NADP-dependent isocitrate dehydrogenase [Sulfurimonas sp. C5]
MSKIIWSKIDEAPALATYSLLPIVNAFTKEAGVEVVTSDISLAGRVLAAMGLAEDELSKLGEVVLQEDANIIKLPNVSASVGQLKDCIAELQGQGYDIPNYPENPANAEEEAIQAKYSVCLGSAVNPVLREGNSDRRAAKAVKKFAQNNPHRLKAYAENSKARVAHMGGNGDFYGNEQSVTMDKAQKVTIALNGKELKTVDALEGEILDGTFMSVAALRAFYRKTIEEAKAEGLIWSVHLKATMMKISDPIMFGHGFEIFFEEVFTKYADLFKELGVNPNLGMSDLEKKIKGHAKEAEIKAAFQAVVEADAPKIAMVDSDKGTTNFNASNDIIIDASMPVVVREGGKQWDRNGDALETLAVIPDSTYAMFHAEMVADCVKNGQYDVTTMGTMQNIGLMAQKAEEYGSHPTTFELKEAGKVTVTAEDGTELMSFDCEAGDIWRMSRAKDIPIKDWVRLTVERTRIEGYPAVFWLDENRAHDAQMIKKVNKYLAELDTTGLDIQIMDIASATRFTNERIRRGENTIAVTGNVLRDHLTDMYPILELGTSAKMLSIVPLLAGGGLYETGAGGSAPKHVEQFLKEGHLRWDSLGEFLALAESLRFIAQKHNSDKLAAVTAGLDAANDGYLGNNKAPGRKAGEPDNKASHFYVAQYWAKALAESDNAELAAKFAPVAAALIENEDKIMSELMAVEGKAQDVGGYYHPDDAKAEAAMRPSATLNAIIDAI